MGGMAAALLLILLATLIPIGTAPPRFETRFEPADALVNLALFAPLGFALARAGRRRVRVLLAALALSASIELLQGLLIPGRRGSGADVVLNTAGAVAGSFLPGAPAFLLAFPLAGWLASGPALRPSAPRTGQWWGQWAHHFGGTVPFSGKILSVRFQHREIPDGPLDSTALLISEVRRLGPALDVSLVAAERQSGVAHLAGVSDGAGHAVIAVEQAGSDLLLTWRSLGAAAGLRPAKAVFPGALASAPGDTLHIHALVRKGVAELSVEDGARTVAERRRLTPLAGWRNLVAVPALTRRAEILLTALWTSGAALLAWFFLRSFRRGRSLSY